MKNETLKDTLTESYETLRDFVVYHRMSLGSPRGLALFLRWGMPGWMEAWSSLASADRARTDSPRPSLGISTGCARPLPAEAAVILAGMVLATVRREIP